MTKLIVNSRTIQALSPWNTKENQEPGCCFPQIKTKKNKNSGNKENKPKTYQYSREHNKQKNQTKKNHKKDILDTVLTGYNAQNNQQWPKVRCKPSQKRQISENQFNFIAKAKKIKKSFQNREILCPKPPTSERKYIRSSSYLPLDDQRNKNNLSNSINVNKNYVLQDIQNTPDFKAHFLKDVHSLYLISKLKAVCQIDECNNAKKDDRTYNYRRNQLKVLTQRTGKHSSIKTEASLKTEGSESIHYKPLISIKKSIKAHQTSGAKKNPNLTQRKLNSCNFYDKTIFQSKVQTYKSLQYQVPENGLRKSGQKCLKDKLAQLNAMASSDQNQKRTLDNNNGMEQKLKILLDQSHQMSKYSSNLLDLRQGKNLGSRQGNISNLFEQLKINRNLSDRNYYHNYLQSQLSNGFLSQELRTSTKPSLQLKTKCNEEQTFDIEKEKEMKKYLRQLRCYIVKRKREECL